MNTTLIWQTMIVAYLLLNTLLYVLNRYLGQNMQKHRDIIAWTFLALFHYPVGIVIALISGLDFNVGWQNFLFIAGGSLIFPAVRILTLRANRDIDAGRFAILSNLTPVITIIAATLLLNQGLNSGQLIGAAIIISAALIISLPSISQRNRKNNLKVGLLISLAVFTLSALGIVFESWMMSRVSYGNYLFYGWGFQALYITLIALPRFHQLPEIFSQKRQSIAIAAYGLVGALQGIAYLVALKYIENASLFGVLTSFTAILVVPAAFFLLHERKHLVWKFAGAAIGTIGLIVLNLAK